MKVFFHKLLKFSLYINYIKFSFINYIKKTISFKFSHCFPCRFTLEFTIYTFFHFVLLCCCLRQDFFMQQLWLVVWNLLFRPVWTQTERSTNLLSSGIKGSATTAWLFFLKTGFHLYLAGFELTM